MKKSARMIASPCKLDIMIRSGMDRKINVGRETGKGKRVRSKRI